MERDVTGEVWWWRGSAPFHVVTVPSDAVDAIGARTGNDAQVSRARQVPVAVLVGIACASTAACSGPGTGPAQAGSAGGTIAAVGAEVERLAVALEGSYRGGAYPTDVAGVLASLDGAGLEPAPGTEIGGYTYDPTAVEFVLCVQDENGVWATYDTAPMSLRESGEDGGCPTG